MPLERLVAREVGDVARGCPTAWGERPSLAMDDEPAAQVVEPGVHEEVFLEVAVRLEEVKPRRERWPVGRVRRVHLLLAGDEHQLVRDGRSRLGVREDAMNEPRNRRSWIAIAAVVARHEGAFRHHVRPGEDAARGEGACQRRLDSAAEFDQLRGELAERDRVHGERSHRVAVVRGALVSSAVAEHEPQRVGRLRLGPVDDHERRARRRSLQEDDLRELDRARSEDDGLVRMQRHELALLAEPVDHRQGT